MAVGDSQVDHPSGTMGTFRKGMCLLWDSAWFGCPRETGPLPYMVYLLNRWHEWWGPWEQHSKRWVATATPQQRSQCARLMIHTDFLDTIPKTEKRHLRHWVGMFQYKALHGVLRLRGELISQSRDQHTKSWPTALKGKNVPCTPSKERLRKQLRAPWRWTQKHKTAIPPRAANPSTLYHWW